MNRFLKTAFLFAAAIASAKAALPVGTFGHEFTKTKGEAVWSIQAGVASYKLIRHNDGKKQLAHTLTPVERKKFWLKMAWPAGTHQNSQCIGVPGELICHVPSTTRLSIPALQSHSSDFFHYDKIGGIIEAQLFAQERAK